MSYSTKGKCSKCASDKGDKCTTWDKPFRELIPSHMSKTSYQCHKYNRRRGK